MVRPDIFQNPGQIMWVSIDRVNRRCQMADSLQRGIRYLAAVFRELHHSWGASNRTYVERHGSRPSCLPTTQISDKSTKNGVVSTMEGKSACPNIVRLKHHTKRKYTRHNLMFLLPNCDASWAAPLRKGVIQHVAASEGSFYASCRSIFRMSACVVSALVTVHIFLLFVLYRDWTSWDTA